MRHKLCILLVFVLIGVVLNVAVAWALWYWWPPAESPIQRSGNFPTASGECLTFFVVGTPWIRRVDWIAGPDSARSSRPGEPGRMRAPSWCWVPTQVRFSRNGQGLRSSRDQWIEGVAGWPLPALRWCLRTQAGAKAGMREPIGLAAPLRDQIQPPAVGPPRLRVLPLEPYWPGFIVDVALYAGALWLLLRFPFAFRRASRKRRGLCLACGYPIGLSPMCTECGKSVSGSRPD